MESMSGAQLLARSVETAGIEMAFVADHPDTAAIKNALEATGSIKTIVPVSETCAVPMADGYTRFTGRPALAVTAGDGHLLNQLVGVTSAWADKQPVMTVAVQSPGKASGSPVFDRERWDSTEAFSAVTRWTCRVGAWTDLPEAIVRGARESLSGRCGPVHIEIDPAVLADSHTPDAGTKAFLAGSLTIPAVQAPPRGDPALAKKAMEMLRNAKAPLVLAGGGVVRSGAVEEINQLALRLGAPITTTMGGMGAALPDNPCYLGPPSYLAGEAFHTAVKKADVVLAVGACFSGLDGFGLPPIWSAKINFIQVNIDPEDISLNPVAELAIVGDAKQVLRDMLEHAPPKPPEKPSQWLSKIQALNNQHLSRIWDEAHRKWEIIHPALIPEAVNNIAGDSDGLVVLDGGNTCLWVGMCMPVPGPRRGFFPMGMGTLGLGIPCAIGIKAAAPDRPVALVSGDGAWLYNAQEIETMLRYNLPIVMIISNDSAWNMIRSGQAMAGEVYGTDLPDQDYTKVAESYGLPCRRVTKAEDIEPAFREAYESGGPAVIDVVVDPNSLPDSLISFGRVEFEGASMPPKKLLKALFKGGMPMDVRGLNLLKFIIKTV